jgi:hypothetical protein
VGGGDDIHVVFGQEFSGEKQNVVVVQQPVLLSPKFGVKSSHIFKQSSQNVTAVLEIECLTFQGESFVNNPPGVKENDEHDLGLLFICLDFSVTSCYYNCCNDGQFQSRKL